MYDPLGSATVPRVAKAAHLGDARGRVVLQAVALIGALLGALLGATSAAAEDEPPAAERAAPTVAVIQGTRVNLRVGPRPGGHAIAQLEDGAVLLIVERMPGWVGVHVPTGFLAAVAAKHVTNVGTDGVRVNANRLNLRVRPPVEGRALPGAFRDQVVRGTVLPLIEREGAWVWVMAPEGTRAYVSAKYVRELGSQTEHVALVKAARAKRSSQLASLARVRREKAARLSGAELREAIGRAQQALYKMRIERGITRAPVVEVINALERSIEACRASPVGARKLATAVRQDLEAELELRTARKDAEVARLRGLTPPAEKPPAPKIGTVTAQGAVRWEAAPTWRNGGEWVLWVGEEPRYVLQLTTGLPHPLPDLKAHAKQASSVVVGTQPGTRVFGLPVLLVRSLTRP